MHEKALCKDGFKKPLREIKRVRKCVAQDYLEQVHFDSTFMDSVITGDES